MNDPEELEQFKTEINLSEFCASRGYQLVRGEVSRNSCAMKHPTTGDKIVIARASHDSHWIYFAVHDTSDPGGSIIDFIKHRERLSLGLIRQQLRPWIGISKSDIQRPQPGTYVSKLEKSSPNRQKVIQQLSTMQIAEEHPYLKSRAVEKEIAGHARFAGRIYIDKHSAAIFPHEDELGICGYEAKGFNGFTSFAEGGQKALWRSAARPDDRRLVLVESSINALSHFAMHYPNEPDDARYISAGGGWNPDRTPALIKRAAEQHPGPLIVMAWDNDDQGKKYETMTRDLLAGVNKTLVTDYSRLKDWNDDHKERAKLSHQELLHKNDSAGYKGRG